MPSVLTFVLIVLAGIFFHHGLTYLMNLTSRRKDPDLVLFGLLCFLGSAYAVSCLVMYRATDIPSFITANKWMNTLARVIMMILPWFIGLYTGFSPKRFLTALTAVFFVLGVLNWVLPNTLLYSGITGLAFHVTPWGEQVASGEGNVSRLVYLLYAAYLSVILYAFEACRRLFARGDKGRARMLMSIAAFAAVGFVNDTLLDANKIRSIYLEEYTLFLFLLVVGTWLGARRIRAEGNYRTLFHAVNDAIFVHDVSGRMLDANEAAARMYGATREELKACDFARLCSMTPPHTTAEARELIRKTVKEGPQIFEWRARRLGDGSLFWAEVALRAEVIDGRSVVLSDVRDISERKNAEEERKALEAQVQQVQKLESLGMLAGGVAHDFNNLLTAVLGNTDLALRDLPPSSPARPPIDDIRTIACRAADMCRQLLAYSGRGGFLFEPVDLRGIVTEISRILEVSISRKVTLTYRLDKEAPSVMADPTQVRQVVMNLITNASEAIGDQEGAISLSVAARHVDRASLRGFTADADVPEGRYVALEVADSGCGMDEKTRARLFEPFFTTKFTGRGLGMAAVLGIVLSHKGAIGIQSAPGSGSTVTVLFPAVTETDRARASKTPQVKPVPVEHGCVLLVDDDEAVLAAVSQLIEVMGYAVLTADSGRKALKLFRESRGGVSCVLLDLTMPDMDGGRTLEELRKIDPNVRVILTSGYSEQEVKERYANRKADVFLQKPYLMEELRAALETALKNPS